MEASLGIRGTVVVHNRDDHGGMLFSFPLARPGEPGRAVVDNGARVVLLYFQENLGEAFTGGGHAGGDVVEDNLDYLDLLLETGV